VVNLRVQETLKAAVGLAAAALFVTIEASGVMAMEAAIDQDGKVSTAQWQWQSQGDLLLDCVAQLTSSKDRGLTPSLSGLDKARPKQLVCMRRTEKACSFSLLVLVVMHHVEKG
jgi:hypothetical protein